MDSIAGLPPELREMIHQYYLCTEKRKLNKIFKSTNDVIWIEPFCDLRLNNEYKIIGGPCHFCHSKGCIDYLLMDISKGSSEYSVMSRFKNMREHRKNCHYEYTEIVVAFWRIYNPNNRFEKIRDG